MNPNAQDLANEIFMSRSFSAHLIVEGDSDFSVIKQHRLLNSGLNIIPAHGQPKLLECMKIVEATKAQNPIFNGFHVHFFSDRDYQIPINNLQQSQNLTFTDDKDFECQMLNSEAFNKVANEVVCEKRLKKEKKTILEFKEALTTSAAIVGALRFFSEKNNESIDFKELQPSKFFDGKYLALDAEKLATHLAGKNKSKKITVAMVKQSVEQVKSESYFASPYLLCSGHDLVLLMSAALKSGWKPKSHETAVDPLTLESMFRLAYSDIFRSAACYKKIFNWLTATTGNNNILATPTP